MSNSLLTTEIGGSIKQFLKYGLVGIASNSLGYLLFFLITHWDVEPKTAMTLLYVVGASIGFIGNRQWAFAHDGTLLWAGTRYFIAHIFGYLINFLILLVFVDRLKYPYLWVQAAAIFVVAGFLFVIFKYFVFPKKCKSYRSL